MADPGASPGQRADVEGDGERHGAGAR
jgi:hypothetical protein